MSAARKSPEDIPYIAILLAAGRGRRFDPGGERDKLLQALPDGDPLVVASAKKLLAATPGVLAVVRPDCGQVRSLLQTLGCIVTVCNTCDQGMGASIVHALEQAQAQWPHAKGWLIALGDMPYLQSGTLSMLLDALQQGADIAAPFYQGRRGNPIAFSRVHLPQLMTLSGDEGARGILKTFPVTPVVVADPGVLEDVDRLSDLKE